MINKSTFKITNWKNLKKKNIIKLNLKKLKKESIICNLPNKLLINYFNNIENNGKVLFCLKKKIIGILVFEKNPNESIKFFKKNLINIFFGLLFKKDFNSKIILLKYSFNYFFLKKINLVNQIILLSVHKKYRNLGLGKKLIQFLRKDNNENIYVTSDLSNYRAHSFYLRNNFNYFNDINLGLRKVRIFKSKFIKVKK